MKTNLTRLRGWAPRGDRLVMDAPFGSWGTQTFIAGLTADAMIAPWVIKGAMPLVTFGFANALPVIDGPAFAAYVEKVLAPELAPGTVVVLDNLATHKNASAAKAMRDAGCWFLFLPPYSPDLNPIEMAFSKLKAHLRRIGARTFTDMFEAIAEICNLYSPQECWNYSRLRICLRLMAGGFKPCSCAGGVDASDRWMVLKPTRRSSKKCERRRAVPPPWPAIDNGAILPQRDECRNTNQEFPVLQHMQALCRGIHV